MRLSHLRSGWINGKPHASVSINLPLSRLGRIAVFFTVNFETSVRAEPSFVSASLYRHSCWLELSTTTISFWGKLCIASRNNPTGWSAFASNMACSASRRWPKRCLPTATGSLLPQPPEDICDVVLGLGNLGNRKGSIHARNSGIVSAERQSQIPVVAIQQLLH